MIRDPFHYSSAVLIIPPALVPCLEFFDGKRSELDLREFLVRLTGDLEIGELQKHLTESLSGAGFLEDENFAARRQNAHRVFEEAPVREAAHAGSGYPDEADALGEAIRGYMNGEAPAANGRVIAIAAPHVSPFGGVEAYRAAYSALSAEDAGRTFLILGTSHYGAPDRIGLTRKPFRTPFGETQPEAAIVDRLARELGDSAVMEDYCHAVEHSIEFQVIFLQHLFGPSIRVAPVLCGAFSSVYRGGFPEDADAVNRIFGALGELAAREGDRLLWVLGVDMAHIGRRYGDAVDARAGRGEMERVEQRDRDRIAQIAAGDARGFWERVRENQDDLKWCGSAPIYTFLKAAPGVRGTLRRYQQWNIDEHSVVSFAGMSFSNSK
jgi:AmmeMemoRadiSam system protein B